MHVQPVAEPAVEPCLPDCQSSNGYSSTFHRIGGGGPLPPDHPPLNGGVATDTGLRCNLAGARTKLGMYNGTICLETFVAGVRNFATYFRWTEEDELFCLRASLWGPVGQLFWDQGYQVMMADLIRLSCQCFGTSDIETTKAK